MTYASWNIRGGGMKGGAGEMWKTECLVNSRAPHMTVRSHREGSRRKMRRGKQQG